MRRVSAMFRPAMGSVSFYGQGVSVAPELSPLRRSISHSAIQSFKHINKETNWNVRMTGSGSMLFRSRHMGDGNANAKAKANKPPKSSDTARVMPHTKLATSTASETEPVARMQTPDYREYARYRNSIRESNMWRDPARPDTNWLKPRSSSTYKPDFANTEPDSLKRSFMRSPDEKSKDMANRDLAKAVQKLRFIPSPAPMSATAQVVRQTADALESLPKPFENKFPRANTTNRRTFMRSATELSPNNQKKRF
ncbi:uncharacterized protein LOC111081168 [Drosophila obscura]|uniref:uncharacterized protein LOC111081168 n=1 Tax=Drosophila obscura TaxID=7282 RepID=UPI001BB1E407|nr:uncharacterized protein LOC111081168 [Drosophila obscura]XP_022232847.2 uncharacterized protein LOC111081168 [Drosophila obscura]XP_022232849.2 uncharacterized protein LOC111081168 [Drosophila obscura]